MSVRAYGSAALGDMGAPPRPHRRRRAYSPHVAPIWGRDNWLAWERVNSDPVYPVVARCDNDACGIGYTGMNPALSTFPCMRECGGTVRRLVRSGVNGITGEPWTDPPQGNNTRLTS